MTLTPPIPTDFDALLAERAVAREEHESLCEICNEADELGRLDSRSDDRDRAFARLEALEAAIEERCADERAAEEA